RLTRQSDFPVLPTDREAWLATIALLKSQLGGLTGSLFMEFNIPRMGRRVDAVLIIGPVVFIAGFKVGEAEFDRAAVEQVWEYALDLRNFHEASLSVPTVRTLIATSAPASPPPELRPDGDDVYRPLRVHPPRFRISLELVLAAINRPAIEPNQ